MKQAVMTKPGIIEFRDVPAPEMGPEEVLLRIKRIGVCGSDVHVYRGLHPYASYPVVQGHEVSAQVERIGTAVSGFEPGDRVTIEPQVSCGKCYACRNGRYNICDALAVIGFQTTGTASDFYVAPAAKLVKLPGSMDYAHGALIEPLAVAVRAVGQVGDLTGQNAVVLGAGPIGNLVAQTAKARGASEVMIVDLNRFRLGRAQECGIDHAVDPADRDLLSAVERAYGADVRADVIFECVGATATMDAAIAVARKGTPIVVVGVFEEKAPIDLAAVNEKELRILGTARYVIEDFAKAVGLVSDGLVQLEPLVTDTFPFSDYSGAYAKILGAPETTLKVMISLES